MPWETDVRAGYRSWERMKPRRCRDPDGKFEYLPGRRASETMNVEFMNGDQFRGHDMKLWEWVFVTFPASSCQHPALPKILSTPRENIRTHPPEVTHSLQRHQVRRRHKKPSIPGGVDIDVARGSCNISKPSNCSAIHILSAVRGKVGDSRSACTVRYRAASCSLVPRSHPSRDGPPGFRVVSKDFSDTIRDASTHRHSITITSFSLFVAIINMTMFGFGQRLAPRDLKGGHAVDNVKNVRGLAPKSLTRLTETKNPGIFRWIAPHQNVCFLCQRHGRETSAVDLRISPSKQTRDQVMEKYFRSPTRFYLVRV